MRERFVHAGRATTEGTVLEHTAARDSTMADGPSAEEIAPSAPEPVRSSMIGRTVRFVGYGLTSLVALFAVAVGGLVLLIWLGFGDARLRDAAEGALHDLSGRPVDVAIGDVSISLSRRGLLVLDASDVSAVERETAVQLIEAGTLQFSIGIRGLLSGELRLGEALIADARLNTAIVPARGTDSAPRYVNDEGLLDPDLALDVVFGWLHAALNAVETGRTSRIRLENVSIEMPRLRGDPRQVLVEDATLRRAPAGGIDIDTAIVVDGRQMALTGEARRPSRDGVIESVTLTLTVPEADEGQGAGPLAADRLQQLTATIMGGEGVEPAASRVALSASIDRFTLPFGNEAPMVLDIDLDGYVVEGQDKLELSALQVQSAGSRWNFNGAIGPTPPEPRQPPSYRFELLSEDSVIAPPVSPEAPLVAKAFFAGRYDPEARIIAMNEIGLTGEQGSLGGRMAVTFGTFGSPGLDLDLRVRDMPAEHLKQFWPWFAAGGARTWVYANILAGQVEEGNIRLSVPPDRFGHGIPLDRDEVSGSFTLRDASFRIAGELPLVHEALGTLSFAGSDADIELSGGRVPMASGREVVLQEGSFRMSRGEEHMIGALDIGISGTVDAAVEFARFEPLDIGRFLDMAPDEMSGTVAGRVVADIPLKNALKAEEIEFLVALDYQDVALQRPIEGQRITEADGSITIDSETVVVDAVAQMNGVPARLNMVEPFGDSTIERARSVSLALDDGNTERLAPGLSMLLSGSAAVAVDADGPRQQVEVDLASSELRLPWVGWAKGQGIPATASFYMAQAEGVTRLEEFALSGSSFSLSGDVSLGSGGLSSARFSRVALNRDDDVAVDITRRGEGYKIAVRGRSFDARALIKYILGNPAAGGAASSDGSGGSIPMTIDAEIDRVVGFHGEILSDVTLSYRGRGSTIDLLELSAMTTSGQAVAYRDAIVDGQRRLQLQSANAGSVLKFLDVYQRMEGGTLSAALAGQAGGPLVGQVDARDFLVVNEPRLGSLVSSQPDGSNQSLSQAVGRDIDTSRVSFERAASEVTYGKGYLALDRGVLRGPLIGATYQGTVYDQAGDMAMTGTFMPAYGLNRLFGEIPILGQILGNGRDRGLIGITFRLYGKTAAPQLQVNPLSVVAPGIFRSIFEF